VTDLQLPPLGAPFAFSQPFDGVVTIQTAGLDYWLWPGISGDAYPPTFVNAGAISSGYSALGQYPATRWFGGNSANGTGVTWPILPVLAPRTNTWTGLRLTWQMACVPAGNVAGAESFVFNFPHGLGSINLFRNGGDALSTVRTGSAVDGTAGSTPASGSQSAVWNSWELNVTAAGVGTLTRNGTVLVTTSGIAVPTTAAAASTTVFATATGGGAAYIANLLHSWTPE
jgi:hypothetical protein